MKKISNILATSLLAISVLVLASGIALGIDNTTYDNTTNATMAVTNISPTPYVEETNVSENTTNVSNATETPYVEETNNVSENATPYAEETNVSENTTEVVSVPTETVAPLETEVPTPVPTPKSPGFESIIAIVAILAVGCMVDIRRR